jgi:hypothetical protein
MAGYDPSHSPCRHQPGPEPGGHPRQHHSYEPRHQGKDAGRTGAEAGIGQPEQPHAQDQDQDGAAAVPEPARRDAGQGGGDVQAKGQLSSPVLVVAGS